VIEIEVDDKPKDFTPEQISAMVLEKMKKTAEVALGCTIKVGPFRLKPSETRVESEMVP
jgi:molecular chaperone DnaK (HSP70)